jgi:hypothetical protein
MEKMERKFLQVGSWQWAVCRKNGFAECGIQGERSSASRVTRFDPLLRPPIFFFKTRLSVL